MGTLNQGELGKTELPEPVRAIAAELRGSGAAVLQISEDHALATESLPWHHRDPFDRMLIAQSKQEGFTPVTRGSVFGEYGVNSGEFFAPYISPLRCGYGLRNTVTASAVRPFTAKWEVDAESRDFVAERLAFENAVATPKFGDWQVGLLRLLAKGFTARRGRGGRLSPNTVKHHLHRIFRTLDATRSAEAVRVTRAIAFLP